MRFHFHAATCSRTNGPSLENLNWAKIWRRSGLSLLPDLKEGHLGLAFWAFLEKARNAFGQEMVENLDEDLSEKRRQQFLAEHTKTVEGGKRNGGREEAAEPG